LRALGYQPQVETTEAALPIFYLDGEGRRAIKQQNGQFAAGTRTFSAQALADEARAHPEHFSPNVLLRPVVQDRLFPTICYVTGPNELAYLAQLGGVYRALGVETPLFTPRASATLLDPAAARFLERHDLPLDALQGRDDSVLNKLLERQLPASLEEMLQTLSRDVADATARLKDPVASVDPTLAGAVDTTRDRMLDTLKTLHSKIIQAAKRKDETLRRQFLRTRALAFPGGQPQERALNVAFFANRYGLSIAQRLLEALPLDTGKHYVLVM
jgi:bacillithiol synthase